MKPKSSILVIDDSPLDRTILMKILKKEGFIVDEAISGEKGLQKIEKEKPDLVLLDLVLPGIDGNETLKQIRSIYSSLELPVIMITVKSDSTDVVESFRLGANDYITKPAHMDVAAMRVQTQLSLARLSKDTAHLKEVEAIHAMITTYNHEINNPLTIALGLTDKLLRTTDHPKELLKVQFALQRISEIVKKIQKTTQNGTIEYDHYSKKSKMVKIRS